MKKKQRIIGVIIGLLFCLVVCGVWQYQKKEKVEEAPYKLYYVNSEITSLTTAPYHGEIEDKDIAIKEILKALKTQSDIEMLPAIPENVEVVRYEIKYGKLDLYFNDAYLRMDSAREVMCRAAVVCSLTQISGISEIMFYVEEEPLMNKNGDAYGYMQRQEFVQNTGSSINSYEMTDFVLYFANAEGDALVENQVAIRCNSGQARESAAIECLLKGPSSTEMQQTIPKGTKLLNVSLHEGVCYLNFNEGLTNSLPNVKPEYIIYSIVNTVVECGNVGMVQIAINGESDIMFQESVYLGEPLSRNHDIVEAMPVEEKKTDADQHAMDRDRSITVSGIH